MIRPRMPIYDPFEEPGDEQTPHQRILSYLDNRDAAADSTQTTCKFEGLPTEIFDRIIDYVPSKSDLAHVCLVNGRAFAIATPRLYEKIRIQLSYTLDPKLVQMFTMENAGLQKVRKVVVAPDAAFSNDPETAFQWLCIVLNSIPMHILRNFHWASTHPLPASLLVTLWQRQKDITCLELVPQPDHHGGDFEDDDDILVEVQKPAFEKVKSLRVVSDRSTSLLTASAALKRVNIESLEVDGRMWNAAGVDDDDDDDSDDTQDVLTSRLFSHLPKSGRGEVPVHDFFTKLTLKDVDLSGCKRTWFTYTSLYKLIELTLEHCAGADIFLMKLADGAAGPRLKIKFIHTIGSSEDRTMHSIAEVLEFPKNTLQELALCLRNAPSLPKVSSLLNHSASLQILLLDITGSSTGGEVAPALIYPRTDFQDLTTGFRLRELAIPLPQTGLEFKKFADCGAFAQYIDMIVQQLDLRTLCMLNWPTDYLSHRHLGYYAAKKAQLARLANGIFRRHRLYDWDANNGTLRTAETKSNLDVVAFGALESNCIAPVHFVENEVRAMGRTRQHVDMMSIQQLRGQALDLSVVDYEMRNFDLHARQNRHNATGEEVDEEEW